MFRFFLAWLVVLCSVANALSLNHHQSLKTQATSGGLSSAPPQQKQQSLPLSNRRAWLTTTAGLASATIPWVTSVAAAEDESMYAPKFVQSYEDFVQAPEGWSYRDVTIGKGDYAAQVGDRVVFDWSGYTIGYFGRPFQAKGGPQGGAFDKDVDYLRTVLGSGKMVAGLEKAFVGMTAGSVRQGEIM